MKIKSYIKKKLNQVGQFFKKAYRQVAIFFLPVTAPVKAAWFRNEKNIKTTWVFACWLTMISVTCLQAGDYKDACRDRDSKRQKLAAQRSAADWYCPSSVPIFTPAIEIKSRAPVIKEVVKDHQLHVATHIHSASPGKLEDHVEIKESDATQDTLRLASPGVKLTGSGKIRITNLVTGQVKEFPNDTTATK